MKNNKTSVLNLESLRTNDSGLLIGGFSKVVNSLPSGDIVGMDKNKDCMTTNNCSGANCRMGCGETK